MFIINRFYPLLLIVLCITSCEKFQYHDYQADVPEGYTDLNNKALSQISIGDPDTLKIAIIGDCQRFYDETGQLVNRINQLPEVDFTVQTGDLTDFGTRQEYLWMHDVLRGLNKPYLAVMGNHDAIANGRDLYKSIYGPHDFSFTLKDIRFVFLNTNGREYNFSNKVPDISWLERQVADTANFRQVVVVCHVFPSSPDFTPALKAPFIKTLSAVKKPVLVVHGHHHNFDYKAADSTGIAYITASSANKNRYVSLRLWGSAHQVILSP